MDTSFSQNGNRTMDGKIENETETMETTQLEKLKKLEQYNDMMMKQINEGILEMVPEMYQRYILQNYQKLKCIKSIYGPNLFMVKLYILDKTNILRLKFT